MSFPFHRGLVSLIVLYVVLINGEDMSHGRSHFQHWYPQYRKHLIEYKADCSAEYHQYLTEPVQHGCDSCYMQPMLDCLLDHMHEFLKSQMAATGILLGLLPTVVSQVGSSTIETGLLALQRPLLAFLLSAATPAISTDSIRAFDQTAIKDALSRPGNRLKVPSIGSRNPNRLSQAAFVSVLQYLFATGAVVNVAHCTAGLGQGAIFAMSPSTLYLPMLYIFLALVIYILGSITVFCRVQTYNEPKLEPEARYRPSNKERLKLAMLPYGYVDDKDPRSAKPGPKEPQTKWLYVKEESWLLWVLTWSTRTSTVALYIFGTLMFSSILFVGPLDGLLIISRYLISAIVCRMIMVYELVGMSKARTIFPEEERECLKRFLTGTDEERECLKRPLTGTHEEKGETDEKAAKVVESVVA